MRQWYVGYFYHGYLKQLKAAIENPKLEDKFKDIKMWYPMITTSSIKDGKREIKQVPIFENYMLFEFESDSIVWTDIKRFTPILKFLSGKDNTPTSLLPEEIENLKEIESRTIFESYSDLINGQVEIIGGPFKDLTGHCKAIIKGRNVARVNVNLFDIIEREVEINLEHLKLIE